MSLIWADQNENAAGDHLKEKEVKNKEENRILAQKEIEEEKRQKQQETELKRENEELKIENERLKRENEQLKNENEFVKK